MSKGAKVKCNFSRGHNLLEPFYQPPFLTTNQDKYLYCIWQCSKLANLLTFQIQFRCHALHYRLYWQLRKETLWLLEPGLFWQRMEVECSKPRETRWQVHSVITWRNNVQTSHKQIAPISDMSTVPLSRFKPKLEVLLYAILTTILPPPHLVVVSRGRIFTQVVHICDIVCPYIFWSEKYFQNSLSLPNKPPKE